MSIRTIITVVALSVMISGTAAQSQQEDGPWLQKGDRTFSLGGGGSSDSRANIHLAAMDMSFSVFITDHVALKLRQGFGIAEFEFWSTTWDGSTRLGLDYFMDFGRFQPYAGANIGWLYGRGVTEQFIAGPNAGARHFVNRTTFIGAELEYQITPQYNSSRGLYSNGRWVYALGMGMKW